MVVAFSAGDEQRRLPLSALIAVIMENLTEDGYDYGIRWLDLRHGQCG